MATQAPDHPGFDILRDLIPHTRKRGMKVIGLFQNSFNEKLPQADKLFEYDFSGKPAGSLCFNNPYHRRFLAGLVDDYLNSYDIDGLMYVNETQGAFNNTIGARFRGRERGLPGSRTCFCEYCRNKARVQDRPCPGESDPPRSREGVRDAVLAAFRARAPGVVLSRMYSEMTLPHLSGAGDAIRQLGPA